MPSPVATPHHHADAAPEGGPRRTRRWRSAALAVLLCCSACGADEAPTSAPSSSPSTAEGASTTIGSTVSTTSSTTFSTTPPPTTSTDSPASDQPVPPAALTCRVGDRSSAGDVASDDLIEASGLVASRRHQSILWATNDSGQRSGIFALDHEGRDLGFFALTRDGAEVATVDVEDLAIADGTLYLADIGDNGRRRDTVAVHLLDEPEPGGDGVVAVRATIDIRYPDGPTDAEALLVDRDGRELLILSKDLDHPRAPTRLYAVSLPQRGGDQVADLTIEAEPAGTLDVTALTAASEGFSLNTFLFPGSVTGADLSPAGDLIAIRTYGSVWFFRHRPGRSMADTLTTTEPCEVGAAAETQGETVAFLPDAGPGTIGYATISEGANQPVHVAVAEVTS